MATSESLIPSWCTGDVERRAWEVGAEVASKFAGEVDRDARFPSEATDAMRDAGLLATMVPVELGGEGASLASAAAASRALAAHCSATALVHSMHQVQIWYLTHNGHTEALRNLLARVASERILMANGNSEVGLGGNVSESICGIESLGDGRFRLHKDVLAMSYGAYADSVLLTARRSLDAAPSEQVLAVFAPGNYTLQPTSEWDTTGLRGTCSNSFSFDGVEDEDLIVPNTWSAIAGQSLGASIILLASVWLGIAEAAARTAHEYIRADARRNIGVTPTTAPLLGELAVTLDEARSVMTRTIADYERAVAADATDSPALLMMLRNLKISSSTLGIEIVNKASLVCGLVGYKKDSPYSMDRHLRDIVGGPIMAHNSRFLADNTSMLLAMKEI